jgi:two-component system sensor histidine kinase AlgZ
MTERPAAASFLPDFCGSRMVFVVVLLAELLAVILTLASPDGFGPPLISLSVNSLLVQCVALVCIGTLCALQSRFAGLPDAWVAMLSYFTALAASGLMIEVTWQAFPIFWTGIDPLVSDHVGFLVRGMGISAIAWALALRYFYVRHQWRRRIESEADARFQALQSRIRPHFLFNCMNTIASLARSSPRLAEEAVEDLADLFRASLADARRPGSLAEELELCRRYLRIEKHRLGDRLAVEWSGLESAGDLRLPALTLQPLLENAIYHGIEPLPGGGMIRIHCERGPDSVRMVISNPRSGAGSAHAGNRLAQDNVAQRLESFFGRAGLLEVAELPGEYRVTVSLPTANENPDR